eukprot:COSAG01_NODE_759_length_13802_cov_16.155221_1_plen_96_part_00
MSVTVSLGLLPSSAPLLFLLSPPSPPPTPTLLPLPLLLLPRAAMSTAMMMNKTTRAKVVTSRRAPTLFIMLRTIDSYRWPLTAGLACTPNMQAYS